MLCRLCLDDTDLCRSHIVPEFFYIPTYDSKHRAHETTLEPFDQRYLQKGHRERLLCKDCEGKISKYETYVEHVWYRQKKLPDRMAHDVLVITGLEYSKFKLFHLSVLWRASVATRSPFDNISLGAHEETVRNMILTEDPALETAHRLAMRSHAALGNRIAVDRQFESCREALLKEINSSPSPRTEALYET